MAQPKQNKELATKEIKPISQQQVSNLLSNIDDGEEFGGSNAETSDLIIPKLMVMQGSSELVKERKADLGDILLSGSYEKLTTREKPTVDVVVFRMDNKTWTIKDITDKKPKTVRVDAYTVGDRDELDQAWEEKVTQKSGAIEMRKFRRDLTYNFFALVPGAEFPFKLSLNRSNRRAGKWIADQFLKASMTKKIPFSTLTQLSVELVNDGENSWFALVASPGAAATEDIVNTGRMWNKTIKEAKNVVVLDDEEVTATDAPTAQPEGETPF